MKKTINIQNAIKKGTILTKVIGSDDLIEVEIKSVLLGPHGGAEPTILNHDVHGITAYRLLEMFEKLSAFAEQDMDSYTNLLESMFAAYMVKPGSDVVKTLGYFNELCQLLRVIQRNEDELYNLSKELKLITDNY